MKSLFGYLKGNFTRYIRLRIATTKLDAIDKLSNVAGYFAFILVVAFCLFFASFFIFLALGFWLGELTGNRFIGMLLVGGFLLLLTFVVLLKSKSVIYFFAGKVASIIIQKRAKKD